jgi:predicted histone-like DNA-binding protein
MIHCGENPGEKFLARLWRNNDINLDTIAEEISNSTTMNYADVIGVVKALEQQISKYILNGSAVKLGMLGSFVPAISSKACDSVDDVTNESIRRVKCIFKPSVKFKTMLSKASLKEKSLEVKGLIE